MFSQRCGLFFHTCTFSGALFKLAVKEDIHTRFSFLSSALNLRVAVLPSSFPIPFPVILFLNSSVFFFFQVLFVTATSDVLLTCFSLSWVLYKLAEACWDPGLVCKSIPVPLGDEVNRSAQVPPVKSYSSCWLFP